MFNLPKSLHVYISSKMVHCILKRHVCYLELIMVHTIPFVGLFTLLAMRICWKYECEYDESLVKHHFLYAYANLTTIITVLCFQFPKKNIILVHFDCFCCMLYVLFYLTRNDKEYIYRFMALAHTLLNARGRVKMKAYFVIFLFVLASATAYIGLLGR